MKAYIVSGSNLGERCMLLDEAARLLSIYGGELIQRSSFYESPPWGYSSSNSFLNQALELDTGLEARDLLIICKRIETQLGRNVSAGSDAYTDRPIDIDIIFFGDKVIEEEGLRIPHPRMTERRFVLEPMAEIAAEFMHPQEMKSVSDLLEACSDNSKLSIFDVEPKEWTGL